MYEESVQLTGMPALSKGGSKINSIDKYSLSLT